MIDRRVIKVIYCTKSNYWYTIESIKIKTEKQTGLSLGSVRRKMARNDHIYKVGKVK
jgi:hypothetical protein